VYKCKVWYKAAEESLVYVIVEAMTGSTAMTLRAPE
jgi:hypothetical protein